MSSGSRSTSIEDSWISSLADSRASRSRTAGNEKGSTTPDTCGPRFVTVLKRFSPTQSSLRTWKESLLPLALGFTAFSTMSSLTWNNWVSEQRADASLAERLGHRIAGAGGSSSGWPTATVGDSRNSGRHTTTTGVMHDGTTLVDAVKTWPTPTSRDWKDGADPSLNVPTNGLLGRAAPRDPTSSPGLLNPAWVEQLMGFPSGWTDFAHWEMHAYQHRLGTLTPNFGRC